MKTVKAFAVLPEGWNVQRGIDGVVVLIPFFSTEGEAYQYATSSKFYNQGRKMEVVRVEIRPANDKRSK